MYRNHALVLVALLLTGPATASLDVAGSRLLTATLEPRASDVRVFGKDDNSEDIKFGRDSEGSDIKFRIRIDAAGQMSFNGVEGPVVDPWGRYSFVVRLEPCAGGTEVDLTVSDRLGRTLWRASREVGGGVGRVEVRGGRVLDFHVSE